MKATQSTDINNGGQIPAELLTDETAAAYIGGIESRTVREWRMKRGLGFLRITPKVIRIRKSDLDRWLSRHAVAITRGGAA
jgi:excisionase family DNA binding protein